ncbi:MAG: hypothetical protein RMJ51_01555 [Candidatus Calescibacterium sp.]|nr:hypothetical protein [Candidatus Calescibacterium sp.]MDW8194915.1 hypothetical protein [Candidatus Calescibacterium sp.]
MIILNTIHPISREISGIGKIKKSNNEIDPTNPILVVEHLDADLQTQEPVKPSLLSSQKSTGKTPGTLNPTALPF